MGNANGRSLSREIVAGIEVQSWRVSRVAGTGLEAVISAIFAELQKVANEVVGLLSVKLPIVRATVA